MGSVFGDSENTAERVLTIKALFSYVARPSHKRKEGGERGASSTNKTGMHNQNEAQSELPGKPQKRSEHLAAQKIRPGR